MSKAGVKSQHHSDEVPSSPPSLSSAPAKRPKREFSTMNVKGPDASSHAKEDSFTDHGNSDNRSEPAEVSVKADTTSEEETYVLDQNRFPDKIRLLLDQDAAPEAIWWLPEGDGVLVNREVFSRELLIRHFRGNKFSSVTRNFNRWGFRRIAEEREPDGCLGYCHDLFRKSSPGLLRNMKKETYIKKDKEKDKGKRRLQEIKADETGDLHAKARNPAKRAKNTASVGKNEGLTSPVREHEKSVDATVDEGKNQLCSVQDGVAGRSSNVPYLAHSELARSGAANPAASNSLHSLLCPSGGAAARVVRMPSAEQSQANELGAISGGSGRSSNLNFNFPQQSALSGEHSLALATSHLGGLLSDSTIEQPNLTPDVQRFLIPELAAGSQFQEGQAASSQGSIQLPVSLSHQNLLRRLVLQRELDLQLLQQQQEESLLLRQQQDLSQRLAALQQNRATDRLLPGATALLDYETLRRDVLGNYHRQSHTGNIGLQSMASPSVATSSDYYSLLGRVQNAAGVGADAARLLMQQHQLGPREVIDATRTGPSALDNNPARVSSDLARIFAHHHQQQQQQQQFPMVMSIMDSDIEVTRRLREQLAQRRIPPHQQDQAPSVNEEQLRRILILQSLQASEEESKR